MERVLILGVAYKCKKDIDDLRKSVIGKRSLKLALPVCGCGSPRLPAAYASFTPIQQSC